MPPSGPLRSAGGRRSVTGGVVLLLALASVTNSASASTGASSLQRVQAAAAAVPFSLVFQDDFNDSVVDKTAWSIFDGPGNGITGPKSKTNTFTRNGHLVLRARQINGTWYGAGVSNAKRVKQTYGKYELMVRFDAGKGVRTAGLIWPDVGWPPEVDFYEIDSEFRTINRLTNHYSTPTTRNAMDHGSYKGDFTQWHRVGLVWTPTALQYTLDGVVMTTMGTNIPHQDMWFGQNVAFKPGDGGPDGTTPAEVEVEIDWIKIYSYTP